MKLPRFVREMTKKQRRSLWQILTSAALFALALLIPLAGVPRALLYIAVYAFTGWRVLRKAGKNILRGQVFDENFLMAVASIGALCAGEFAEAVAVMLFYQVGELFESCAVSRSRKSIAALMDIRPDCAHLERDGETETVDPEQVGVGDVIVILPGERVPLDGEVLSGMSSLDTAALTGESVPREVMPGDAVVSGCINQSGVLRVRVAKPFGESTVSKILDLVENAAARKAKSESFITKFARWYTPAVCLAALALAILPPLFVGGWGMWISRALVFLVVSCPCALVISVPLSFFGGIGGASANGILIKGGNYMETLAKVDRIAFDKTGTLTEGSFEVVAVQPEGMTEEELIEIAAHAEQFSLHPIAASLRRACTQGVDEARVSDVREIPGCGVMAKLDGREVAAGNFKLMQQCGTAWKECKLPGTAVHVAVEGGYAGCIVIADRIKPRAREAIERLKRCGVRECIMLTGDRREVAEAVAAETGVDRVVSDLLPDQKVEALEAIMAETASGCLAFAGDGINDAPVLSRADVGIAMGAMGTDAAIEAADVVLMDDDPMKIASAIEISKKTLRIVVQNIVFALGVKFMVLALSVFGMADMWLAVFADVGVSIIAILNAMRALRFSEKT